MRTTIFLSFLLSMICNISFCQMPTAPAPLSPPRIGAYDTLLLRHYLNELKIFKDYEDKVTAELIAEINKTAHPVLKEELILLLGELDNEMATRFLVSNLTYRSRYIEDGGVESSFMHLPCLMALISKKSLHALPFIEEFLQECRTRREITLLYMVLSTYISKLKLDTRWIKEMLPIVPENTCKEQNVEKLIILLKQNRFIR